MKLETQTRAPLYKRLSTPLLVIAILAIGAIIAGLFIVTKPTSKRIRPALSSPTVITELAKKEEAKLIVSALGTVRSAQETIVRARVSGQVEKLGNNFEPGGIIKKDDLILQLDNDDYLTALALKQSSLAEAKANYDLEMGQQDVARSELKQLEKLMPQAAEKTALALRKPQLAQAKAALQAAEADAEQAKLNLDRTKITAPYNALVLTRNVSLGSQASSSDTLATIASTDEYRIEAAIPLDKLQALGISVFDGAKVNVYTATNNMREGNVLHSIASLDETTRMGRVLVSVMDPLGLKSNLPHLLLGDQVRVELQAGVLPDVVTLPRVALRSNDTVWVAVPTKPQTKEQAANLAKGPNAKPVAQSTDTQKTQTIAYTLDIRSVKVAWKDPEFVVISQGIEQGERIIISPLGAPIQNMPLRIATPQKDKQSSAANKSQVKAHE